MGVYINPFTDFGFKRIFGEEDNKDLLIDFLNELLLPQGITIGDLTYKPTARLPLSAEDRKVVFDLHCTNQRGDRFTVELQKAKQTHFKDRMLYYSSFTIQEQGKQGPWDYRLDAVYMIAILEFMFDKAAAAQKVVGYHRITDVETHAPFTDKLTYITIEIPRFTKTEGELETNLDRWLYLLKHLHEFERVPAALQTRIMQKVFRIAEYTKLSKEAKQQYEESLKAYNDLKNTLDTAENTGFKKAEEKFVPMLEEAKQREEEAKQREEEERRQKEEERRQKEEAKAREEEERRQKEEAKVREEDERKQKEEAKQTVVTGVKNMLKMGMTIEQVAQTLGKSEADIRDLLGE